MESFLLSTREQTRGCCVLFVLAAFVAMVASGPTKYPFAERLILWLTVPLAIFFASGALVG